MKIEIADRNEDSIESALYAVNGKASAFTVSSYAQARAIVKELLAEISDLPLHEKAGARATYTPAGPSAKAYKFWATSTEISLQVASDGKRVFLVGVQESRVYPRQPKRISITLTAKGYDSYVAACKARFHRADDAAAIAAQAARDEAAYDRREADAAYLI